ncbi:MAG: hypothetical protein ACKVS9_01300, partial [Phycisphaerae bacterium]
PKAGCAMKHRQVTAKSPCPACGKDHWCAWLPDGALRCQSGGDCPSDMKFVRTMRDGAKLFAPIAASHRRPTRTAKPVPKQAQGPTEAQRTEFDAAQSRFADACTPNRRDELASQLGVTSDSLQAIGVGWATPADLRALKASGAGWPEMYPDGAFTFPERDGGGRIVGFSFRTQDGRKGSPSGKVGSRRGLIVPTTLADDVEPVLIVEGASDVATCTALDIPAVGRPSNTGGSADLARLLVGRSVLVVGENDQKASGQWPGCEGAERVAGHLATEWGEPVAWTLPPIGAKDVREWLKSRVSAGLSLTDGEACKAAGADLLAALVASEQTAEGEQSDDGGGGSQADRLVSLALERYRFGQDETGEPFAVPIDGPNVARSLAESKRLSSELASLYHGAYSKVPSASALADARSVLAGKAAESPREPVKLRIASHDNDIIIDLGDEKGCAIRLYPGGWEILNVSPLLFRRSSLTGELPEPVRGGDLRLLRECLNVTDSDWHLLVGWMVAGLLPNISHPILLLGGYQGTGKSSATRMLVMSLDPSPAPLSSPPTEPESWAVVANASYVIAIDNISAISRWWSDALCKSVGGDGWMRRARYTDKDVSVLSFRRCIILNSIDAGALRGDLGERLLLIDLERITSDRRRSETDIQSAYENARGQILGALLDVAAQVLLELPNVKLDSMPRMADFARVLAALDTVLKVNSLDAYLGQKERVATDVLDSDSVGEAVRQLMDVRNVWTGSATALDSDLKALPLDRAYRDWPASPSALSRHLSRIAPSLAAVGIDTDRGKAHGGMRHRVITLRKSVTSVTSVPSVTDGAQGVVSESDSARCADETGTTSGTTTDALDD